MNEGCHDECFPKTYRMTKLLGAQMHVRRGVACNILEGKMKNWSRTHELKQMMKINILVNIDHNKLCRKKITRYKRGRKI